MCEWNPWCVCVFVCVSGIRTVSLFDDTRSNNPAALQPLKQLLAPLPSGTTVVEDDVGGLMLLLRADSMAYSFIGESALRSTHTHTQTHCT